MKKISFFAFFAVGILFFSFYDDAYALKGSNQSSGSRVEIVRTIPGDSEGIFEQFVKICAGENNRLERPNVIVSSDKESFREQVFANIAPNTCAHKGFIVEAKDPSSITVEIIDSRNF